MRIPTRNGVGPSRVSLPAGPWSTVLDFLLERMPDISRDEWLHRFAHSLVLNEEAQPVAATQAYTPHTKLYYYRHIANEPVLPQKASIVFEDDHLIVAPLAALERCSCLVGSCCSLASLLSVSSASAPPYREYCEFLSASSRAAIRLGLKWIGRES